MAQLFGMSKSQHMVCVARETRPSNGGGPCVRRCTVGCPGAPCHHLLASSTCPHEEQIGIAQYGDVYGIAKEAKHEPPAIPSLFRLERG